MLASARVQGQLLRSDAPLAELMDQDTASGASTRTAAIVIRVG